MGLIGGGFPGGMGGWVVWVQWVSHWLLGWYVGPGLSPDNQDYTLRFRRDAHGSTFPCFFKILFCFNKGFSTSCDKFTTQMYLGVICTFCVMIFFFFGTLQVFKHGHTIAITTTTRPQPSQHYSSQVLHRSYCKSAVLDVYFRVLQVVPCCHDGQRAALRPARRQ
jgi:hypothetical protein